MKIAIISFTRKGMELSFWIKEKQDKADEIVLFTKAGACKEEKEYVEESLSDWTKEYWKKTDVFLFIGACGIAVRAIAPFVEDKLKDPAVVVVDEEGQFVIPILSGHVGGANEWAKELSAQIGALPVITTATDLHGIFAVDVFAKKNNFGIADHSGIAKVSSALLEGEAVSVLISPFEGERATLQLCPKNYVVGIGCRRGKSMAEIEALMLQELREAGIKKEAVAAFASIDKKASEEGILSLAEKYGVSFFTYSATELKSVDGDFSASEFVEEQVGVDNVCERAALYAAGQMAEHTPRSVCRTPRTEEPPQDVSRTSQTAQPPAHAPVLVRKKAAKNGVTVAVAKFFI